MPPDRTHRHRHRPAALRSPAAWRAGRTTIVRVEGGGARPGAATIDVGPASELSVDLDPAPELTVDLDPAPDPSAVRLTTAPEPSVDLDPAPDAMDDESTTEPGAGGYSHDELLSLARTIQAAAVVEDIEELVRTVRRLREALRCHVASERDGQDHLPAALRAVVFGGQDRLLRLVDRISVDVDADGGCACVKYGAELVVALRRQAALEAAALRRPADLV